MKKAIKKSCFVSLLLTIILLLINLVCVITWKEVPLAITIRGGEYISRIGFGIIQEKIYSLSTTGSAPVATVSFHLVSFVITWVILELVSIWIIFMRKLVKG